MYSAHAYMYDMFMHEKNWSILHVLDFLFLDCYWFVFLSDRCTYT